MNRKETVETYNTTQRSQPTAPPDAADAAARRCSLPAGDYPMRALPARFLEGTAWDEV